jgi:hypothetical protein
MKYLDFRTNQYNRTTNNAVQDNAAQECSVGEPPAIPSAVGESAG